MKIVQLKSEKSAQARLLMATKKVIQGALIYLHPATLKARAFNFMAARFPA